MSETIDNKVVRIDFDNREFKNKIEETISKLDKLNKSVTTMDHKNTIRTFNTNVKSISPKPIDDFTKSLNGLQVSFSKLEVVSATVIASMTRSFMNFSKNVYAKTIGQIKSGGMQRALNIEQAKFQMEGLGKQWKDVAEDIEYAVKGTAYGLDEAARVSSQLLASQVKTGKEMRTSLRAISGIAAMTNRSYSDIGNIFTKVSGNGRLMSQELLQFSASGLNAAATLTEFLNKNKEVRESIIKTALVTGKNKNVVRQFANSTKLTEGNIRQLVTAGAIDFKTFAKAMDDAFGKHATAADKTFNGALANMKAALSRLGADFYGDALGNRGFLENMRRLFISLRKAIDEVRATVKPFAESVTALATTIQNRVVGRINKFTKNLKKGRSELVFFTKTATNILDKLTKSLGGKVKHASDKAKKSTDEHSKSTKKNTKAISKETEEYKKLEKIANKVIDGAYGNGAERQKKLTKAGYDYAKVQNVVNHKLLGTKLNLSKLSKEEEKREKTVVKLSKSAKKIKKDIEDVEKANNALKKNIKKNINASLKNTLSIFESLIGAISDAESLGLKDTKSLYESFERLTARIKKATKAIKEFVDTNRDKITTNVTNIVRVFKNAFKVVKIIITAFSKSFRDSINVGGVINKTSKTISKVISNISKLSEKFADYAGKNIYKIVRTLNGLFSILKVIQKFTSIPLKIALKVASKLFGSFGVDILDVTANIGDMLVKLEKWIDKVLPVDKIVDGIADAVANFIDKLVKLYEKLDKKTIIDGFLKIIRSLPKKIKKAAKAIGKFVVEGFNLGFTKSIKKLVKIAKTFVTTLITNVKKLLGIHSPSTVFFLIGMFCMMGLMKGFESLVIPINEFIIKFFADLFGISSEGTEKIIKAVNTATKELWKVCEGIYKSIFKLASEGTPVVIDIIVKGLKRLRRAMSGLKPIDFKNILAIGGLVAVTVIFTNTIKPLIGMMDGFGTALVNVSGLLTETTSLLKTVKANIKVSIFKSIAMAVAVMAACVVAVSQLPQEDLNKGLKTVGILMSFQLALLWLVSKMSTDEFKVKQLDAARGFATAVAVSILGMIVAFKTIAKITKELDKKQLENFYTLAGVFGVLLAEVATVFAVMAVAVSDTETPAKIVLSIVATLLMLVVVFRNLFKITKDLDEAKFKNMETMLKYMCGILGIIGAVAVLVTILGKETKNKAQAIPAIGKNIVLIAATLFLLMETFKGVSELKVDGSTIIKNIGFMVGAIFIITRLFKILQKYSSWISGGSAFAGLLGIVVAIGLISVIVSQIGKVDARVLAKGITAVVVLGLLVKSFVKTVTYMQTDTVKMAGTLIGFAICIAILAIISVLVGLVSLKVLVKGVATVAVLSVFVGGLIAATEKAQNIKFETMGALVGAVAILGGIAYVLGKLKMSDMIQGVIGVALVGACVVALAWASKYAAGIDTKNILQISLGIAAIGVVIAMLASMDTNGVYAGIVAIAAIAIALAITVGVIATVSKTPINPEALIGAVASIAVLSLCIALLATFNPTAVKTGAIAIGGLALVMTLVTALTAAISHIPIGPGAPIMMMITILVAVTAAIGILAFINKEFGDVTPITKALATFMLSLAEALKALAVVGAVAALCTAALPAVGAVIGALTSLMVGLGALSEKAGPIIDKGGPILVKIGSFIGDFIGKFLKNIITGIGEGIANSISAIGKSFSDSLGPGLSELGKGIKQLPENSGSILSSLAGGLAVIFGENLMQKIGNIASLGLASDPIETFTKSLSGIATAIKGLMDGLEGYNFQNISLVATAVKDLADSQKALDGIDESGAETANKAASFTKHITKFLKAFSKINVTDKDITKVKMLKKVIDPFVDIAKKLSELNDGESSWNIKGDNKLSGDYKGLDLSTSFGFSAEGEKKLNFKKFGEQLKAFGDSFKLFRGSIKDIKESDATQLERVSETIVPFVDIAERLAQLNDGESSWKVSAGGPLSIFGLSAEGEKKLNFKKFGENLKAFGESLVMFSNSVGKLPKNTKKNFENVSDAVEPFVSMAEKLSEMDDGEGKNFTDFFNGEEMNFTKLGEQLVGLGDSLVAFAASIGSLEDKDVTSIKRVPDMVSGLVDIAKRLSEIDDSNESGWFSWFEGKKLSLDKFGKGIKYLGDGLKAFVGLDKLNMNQDMIARIKDSTIKIMKLINEIIDSDYAPDDDDLADVALLGDTAKKLANGLKDLKSSIDSLPLIDDATRDEILKTINNLGKLGIDEYVKPFDSKESKSKVKTSSKALFESVKLEKGEKTAITENLKSTATSFVSAFKTPITDETSTSAYDEFVTAGSNVIQGFIDGINSQAENVKKALKTVMKAGIKISMKTLDEHSPSKIFKTIGKFTMTGFVQGIESEGSKVINKVKGTFDEIIKTAKKKLVIGAAFLEPYVKAIIPNIETYTKGIQKKIVKQAFSNIVGASYWLYKRTDAYLENNLSMKALKADNKKQNKILTSKKNIKKLKQTEKQYRLAKYARKAAEKADKKAGTTEAKVEKANLKKAGKKASKEERKLISAYNAREKKRVAKQNEINKKNAEKANKNEKKLARQRLNDAIKQEKKAKSKFDKIKNKMNKAKEQKKQNKKTNIQLQKQMIADMNAALAEFYNGIKESIDSYMDPLANELLDTNIFEKVERAQYISVTSLIRNSEENNKRLSDYFSKTSKLNALGISDSLKEYVLSLGLDGEGVLDALLRANSEELKQIDSNYKEQSKNDMKNWILQQETKENTLNAYKKELLKLKNELKPEVYERLVSMGPEEGLRYVRMLNNATPAEFDKFNKLFKKGIESGEATAKTLVGKFAEVAAGSSDALTTVLNAELGKTTKNAVLTGLTPSKEDIKPVKKEYTKAASAINAIVKTINTDGKNKNISKSIGISIVNSLSEPFVGQYDVKNPDSVAYLAAKVGNGIVTGLSRVNANDSDKIKDIGRNVLEGITKGMGNNTAEKKLRKKIKSLSNKTIETFKEVLDINSPSRAFARESKFIPLGVGKGVEDNTQYALNPIKRLSQALVNTYNNVIDDSNLNPVVKPTVDLSDVESGISTIGDMFNRELAIDAATSFKKGQNAKGNSTQIINNNYNNRFNQSITSDTPLSRTDIYRDTMGLIRRNMRGGLTV